METSHTIQAGAAAAAIVCVLSAEEAWIAGCRLVHATERTVSIALHHHAYISGYEHIELLMRESGVCGGGREETQCA